MVTAISLKWQDKEFLTFFEVLCAVATGSVKSSSLPAEVFCATGCVRAICSVQLGRDKDGDSGGCSAGETINSLLGCSKGGKGTQPQDLSQF